MKKYFAIFTLLYFQVFSVCADTAYLMDINLSIGIETDKIETSFIDVNTKKTLVSLSKPFILEVSKHETIHLEIIEGNKQFLSIRLQLFDPTIRDNTKNTSVKYSEVYTAEFVDILEHPDFEFMSASIDLSKPIKSTYKNATISGMLEVTENY